MNDERIRTCKAKLRAILARQNDPKNVDDDQAILHPEADAVLVECIGDPEMAALYGEIRKWYA